MKVFDTKDIRNVGLLSHGGAGKTTLAEAFLFTAKVTNRLCKVTEKNSNLDYEPEEQKRLGTMKTALAALEWRKTKINLIDTPGDTNFFAETREALIAMDSALLLVSAVDGVEVGTSRCWGVLRETHKPTAIVVSKLDRERADFERTLGEIREQIDEKAIPMQWPIGIESGFKGVVDLVHMKAHLYKGDDSGDVTEAEVPASVLEDATKAREALVEAVAETSDELMESFFEHGGLTDAELESGLASAFRTGRLVPVYCTAAISNIGVRSLMDEVVADFPTPLDRGDVGAHDLNGGELHLRCAPDEPFAGYVFKTVVDPYAGQLTLFRIFSGTLGSDGTFLDASTGEKERFSALFTLIGKKQDTVSGANAGDIVCVAKLKRCGTQHTITDEKRPAIVTGLPRPNPVISFAIVPKSQSDEGKLSSALHRILDEDIALQSSRDEQTKEFLLSGMGQVHVEMTVEKLHRKYGVDVELRAPKVPYRETIRKKVTDIQGRHKKQTGGAGQFGDIVIDMWPNERGKGFEFVDAIVGGAIPRNFIPAVEKGFIESMDRGYLAGCPVVDVVVKLHFGSYHSVDSSEIAFKTAAHIAFKKAMELADPCLLEPVMAVAIIVPEENMGDVMGDLNTRRGRVTGMDSKGTSQIIRAWVPLAEMLRYAPDLRSMTSGRGEFTMEVSHYDQVPDQVAQKVIQERKVSHD